jgi:hypothetical protein
MADKQAQALKRLTKKLNALRKTLRADERSLLDRMVLGEEVASEVAAHRFTPKAADKAAEVAAHRFTPKAAEVVAHRFTPKAANKAAEVVAHQMKPKAAGKTRPMIVIDWGSGNYVAAAEGPEVEGHLLKETVTPKVTPKVAPKNMP